MYLKNSNRNNNNTSSGIGFTGLLQLLFIALKLTGFINWSWWLVLSPSIIIATIFIILLLIATKF